MVRSLPSVLLAVFVAVSGSCLADAGGDLLQGAGFRGGLVLHVGCGGGELTGQLAAAPSAVVVALTPEGAAAGGVRARLHGAGLGDRVTVSTLEGDRLPLVAGIVNLAVVGQGAGVPDAELRRVLAPGGVVLHLASPAGAVARRWVKPVMPAADAWTHYLRDASNNAVSPNRELGPPRSMQWLASPIWSRHHDKQASISAAVTAGGRLFYIVDRGPTHTPHHDAQWQLEARDAHNGILLWQRPMGSWVSHMRRFRSGPVQLARLLVTDGEKVWVTLGIGDGVSVLSAVDGQPLATFENTANAEELLRQDDLLLAVVGDGQPEHAYVKGTDFRRKALVAADAQTGMQRWRWPAEGVADIVPQTLAAVPGRILLQQGDDTLCLDAANGLELWRQTFAGKGSGAGRGRGKRSPGWAYATLVVHDGVVLSCNGGLLDALALADGAKLWSCEAKTPFGKVPSVDILVVDGVVWTSPSLTQGRDLRTGRLVKSLEEVGETVVTAGHHHRCYRNKAAGQYLVYGWRGMEFLDTVGEDHSRNNWVRGVCQYGVLPANGLWYLPPNNCGCYPEALLHGFYSLATDRGTCEWDIDDVAGRLTKGPAHTAARDATHPQWGSGWPSYRGGSRRGGIGGPLPAGLSEKWSISIGGELTPPVVGEGGILVVRKDTNTIVNLDGTGGIRWQITAPSTVDSTPTIHRGQCLFGCADGYVYAHRLSDGELAWRFRAAPRDLRTVSLGKVESLWPVHGSVMVKDGIAYVAAGRSSYLDGGLALWALDAVNGSVKAKTILRSEHPGPMPNTDGVDTTSVAQNKMDHKTVAASDRSDAFSMEGNTSDIFVADADAVYLRHMRFTDDLQRTPERAHHLFSTFRLLDDNEAHRSHWFYGNGDFARLNVAYEWITRGNYGGFKMPFGTLLVFDAERLWGVFGRAPRAQLFSSDIKGMDARIEKDFPANPKGKRGNPEYLWKQALDIHPRALLRAGDSLYVAGATDVEQLLSGEGGVLRVHPASGGEATARLDLPAPPVFDGLAAAYGRLYVSLANGTVICLGE